MAGEPCPKTFREPKPRKRLRAKRKTSTRARPAEPLRWRCEICGENRASDRHHKLRRSQGGTDDATNTMDLCGWCHAEVHANPEHSYREGYLIRSSAAEKGTR
jgi:predicted restriction endonuclease